MKIFEVNNVLKGKLLFLAVSACISIMMCRFHFNPFFVVVTCSFFIFLLAKKRKLLFLLCLVTSALFSWLYISIENSNETTLKEGNLITSGYLSSIPTINGNQFRANIKINNGEKLSSYYTIKTKREKEALANLKPGDVCGFTGDLVLPKSPTMPNAFNYKQYLHDHYIHWQFQLDEVRDCKKNKNDLLLYLLKIRQKGLDFIKDNFPISSVGIVQALLFGERNMLDTDVELAYQQLGIVHLLAISGLHVGLLVSGIYALLIYSGLTHEKTRIILIILLPMYIVVTGAAPSVIRASFMVILYFIFKLAKKKVVAVDVISFTFLVLLTINPYYLFQIGFQLSYVVSFGLLLSFGIIEKLTSWIAKLAVVSVVAQLLSLPLLIYHFYEISMISVPMNMLFVPLYSFVVLPLAIVSSFMTMISSTIGAHVITVFSHFLQQTHQLVLFASTLPYTTYTAGKPPLFVVACLVFFTFNLFLRSEQTTNLKLLCRPAVYVLLILLIPMVIPYVNPNGKVLFIDVGQGDSIFIQRPFNKGNYLIDTGGRISFPKEDWEESSQPFSIASDVTVPYLKSLGITELDALFLTHGDFDHIGETQSLIDEIKIKELIIPEDFVRGEFEQQTLSYAMSKMIDIKTVKAGDQLWFNDFTFYVVAPSTRTASKNDDSLVLWFEVGGLKWLLTGDGEMDGEARIINLYPSLRADVLKLGHHGSKTSSSENFLEQIQPSIAVVSVGHNNRYQHPHTEVLERMSIHQIPLFRTDTDGAIMYQFKGNTGTFSIYPPYIKVK